MDLDDEELIATRKLHGQNDGLYENKKIQKDKEIDILIKAKRKLREEHDIEAAKIIIEKCLLGPWIITRGRIDYIKLALRVLLSEIEKNKEKIEEQQERINYLEDNRKQVKEQIESAEMDLGFAIDMLTDI